MDLAGILSAAQQELTRQQLPASVAALTLSEESEKLRWFVLPQEIAGELAAAGGSAADQR